MKKALSLIISLLFLVSCVEESVREGRKVISNGATTPTEEFCTSIYNISAQSCVEACPAGTRLADSEERLEAIAELEALTEAELDSETKDEILNNINAAQGVCLEGSGVLRPDGQVFVDSDVCACQNGNNAVITDCAAFCSTKTQANKTLFGTVTVGTQIQLNKELGNLQGWCNNEIGLEDLVNPGCQLEVFDGSSTQFLNVTVSGNSFTSIVDQLEQNKTYIARIVETQSGSNVSSDAFQFRLKEFIDDTTTPQGNLKIMPVNQYSCIFLARQNDPVVSFTEYAKRHYYFASSNTPPSLPPSTDLTKCHDKQIYGEDDDPLTPRLDLINQHFAVWDQTDSRFNDGDGDGVIDMNAEIQELFRTRSGSANAEINLFSVFAWPNFPEIPNFKDEVNANLGLIMIPFIDANQLAECPDEEDYNNSGNILYEIIGEKVGVPTEGLYMAESEPYLDSNGQSIIDILLIREGDLKKVWFYREGTELRIPDAVSAGNKTLHFYWPLDFNAPLVKKSTSITFTVRFPDEIGKNGVTTGVVTGNRPNDKRFACIPAID
ncbi:MAG: hypothetical protein VXV96_14000 [Bdellovibrionota bacterium]|jgi:hypothetical protein|nr:hypothetical protein [Bdellovibrionota bacterium]